MIDYVIDNKDFVQYEADIVMSGCIKELMLPKLYRENGKVYWVYHDTLPNSGLKNYGATEIQDIKKCVKNYMLNPENIIFHPTRIYEDNGVTKYHYLPTNREILYSSNDLLRYINCENEVTDLENHSRGEKNDDNLQSINIDAEKNKQHFLFFVKEKRLEKLILNVSYVGRDSSYSIFGNFDGCISVTSDGILSIIEGEAHVNGSLVTKNSSLQKGDKIKIGSVEILFW